MNKRLLFTFINKNEEFSSGPESGGDIEGCFDFTTTAPPPTTSTVSSSTTTGPGEECDQFVRATCDIDESNMLDLMHDLLVGQCQAQFSTSAPRLRCC